MATEDIIKLEDLTNGSVVNGEWVGTGVFDVLLSAVNSNIKIEYDKGRLKGADYASVYLGSMQSTLASSVDFLIREKTGDAQIGDIEASTLLKEAQLMAQRNKDQAELEKHWGYETSRADDDQGQPDPQGEVIMGNKLDIGKIDAETRITNRQTI